MQKNPEYDGKETITFTPKTGITVSADTSFIKNGVAYINLYLQKSSDFTAYEEVGTIDPKPPTNTANACGAFADSSNLTKCALYGYVRSSDGSVVVTPQSGVSGVRRAMLTTTYQVN